MFKRIATFTLRRCSDVSRRTVSDSSEKASGSETPQRTTGMPVLTGERGINKVVLIGRVGRDPEVRGTDKTATIFSLATSQSYKMPDDSFKQYTEWHRVVIFKKTLGSVVAQRVGKGDRVYVSGSINYTKFKYEDKIQNLTQIRADDVVIVSKRHAQSSVTPSSVASENSDEPEDGEDLENWDGDEADVSSR